LICVPGWIDKSSLAHSPIPQANFELRLRIVVAVIDKAAALPVPLPLPFPLPLPLPFPLVLLHVGQLLVEELLLRLEEIVVILQSGQLVELLLVGGGLLLLMRGRRGPGSLVGMVVMVVVVVVGRLVVVQLVVRMALQLVVVVLQAVAALQLRQLGIHLGQAELKFRLGLLLVGLLGLLQPLPLAPRRVGQLLRRRLNLDRRVVVVQSVVMVQRLCVLAVRRHRPRSGRGSGYFAGQRVQRTQHLWGIL